MRLKPKRPSSSAERSCGAKTSLEFKAKSSFLGGRKGYRIKTPFFFCSILSKVTVH